MDTRSYLTVKHVATKYPAFSEGSIRWAIFNRDKNGFAGVCRKVGRRVLIDEALFIDWINNSTMG